MQRLRFVLGVSVLLLGVVILGVLDAEEWQFPLFGIGLAPFLLVGGLLVGLDKPPKRGWRAERRRAR
jgi:hypothetical protein